MADEESSQVHAAVGEAIRHTVMVGMQVAELTATLRMGRAQEAQSRSDADRAAVATRMRAERGAAMPLMRQAWDHRWWDRAAPWEIGEVWRHTAEWAGSDPYAQATLEHMRGQARQRYGLDLQAGGWPPAGQDIAALLATRTPTSQREPGTQRIAEHAPEQVFATDNEPAFREPATSSWSYVVRDAEHPGRVLAHGSLPTHPAATPADAAIAGLRAYSRGTAADPAGQVHRLLDLALAQGQTRQGDVDGVVIDVWAGEATDGPPAYSLAADALERVRAEQRARRQHVIDGRAKAPAAEVLAAIELEERAAREELHERQARVRGREADELMAAQQDLAETQERLADLGLRHRVAIADLRGEDGSRIVAAAALRESLDEDWWQTASAAEVGGVWEHVQGWSDGEGKRIAQAELYFRLRQHLGVSVAEHAGGAEVAQAIEAFEQSNRTTRQEPPDRADDPEQAGEEARGQSGEGAAIAEQDQVAAAALAAVDDAEAAGSVTVAKEGFRAGATPSQRLNGARSSRQSRPRSPQPPRRRDPERGR